MKLIIYSSSTLIRTRILKLLAPLPEIVSISLLSSLNGPNLYFQDLERNLIILDLANIGSETDKHVNSIIELNPMATIVVFNDFTDKSIHEKCFNFGAHYCLDKSKDFEQLIEIVQAKVLV